MNYTGIMQWASQYDLKGKDSILCKEMPDLPLVLGLLSVTLLAQWLCRIQAPAPAVPSHFWSYRCSTHSNSPFFPSVLQLILRNHHISLEISWQENLRSHNVRHVWYISSVHRAPVRVKFLPRTPFTEIFKSMGNTIGKKHLHLPQDRRVRKKPPIGVTGDKLRALPPLGILKK